MQLISSEYFYAKRGGRDKRDDKLVLILKDSKGQKVRKVVNGTKITYYISKEEYWDERLSQEIPTEKYIPKDQVYPVKTKYSELYSSIIDELDDKSLTSYYRSVLSSGENINMKLRKIHLDNRLHGTDVNIEDYYIGKWLKKHPSEDNYYGLTKVFFDIEVDSSMIKGFPEPEEAICPVNAISLVDPNRKVINEYLLAYPDNESYRKFIKKKKKFKERIKEKYGNEFEVKIFIFDEEIELIAKFFDYINKWKPDFASAWNMDFDIPYLVTRCGTLGYEATEICCPEEIPNDEKVCTFRIDKDSTDPAEKHSTYRISSYTNYIDEMSLYANITKPLGKKESYSLDFIGEEETGMRKEEVTDNMKTFHLVDYERFVEYSIQDSVMLSKIEEKTSHMDLLYGIAMITRTKVQNALKKTVSIANMISYYADDRGLVKSNNRSKLYDKPDGKIPGAFVANSNNIDHVGVAIAGALSRFIFECVTDLDLASLYPSIIRAFNLSLDTFIGYLEMNHKGYTGGDFIQDYISGDIVNVGMRYFNLPGIDEIYNELKGVA